MNIFYKSPVDFKSKSLFLNGDNLTFANLKSHILQKENILEDVELKLYNNGKILNENLEIYTHDDLYLHVALPIKGGKGGFGSMLRAIGAQIEKTTNREACRDLSGRRLRDVNEEKRLKDWLKKQAQKKEEEEKKKKEKLKRLAERTLPATCQYNDTEFERTRAEIPDIVEESITYGLKQSSSKTVIADTKRKSDAIEDAASSSNGSDEADSKKKRIKTERKPIKKQALWLGVEVSDDSDDDSDDEAEADTNDKIVKSSMN